MGKKVLVGATVASAVGLATYLLYAMFSERHDRNDTNRQLVAEDQAELDLVDRLRVAGVL